MILVIDNYDSFTYNLVQYLGELEKDIRVYRNDQISLEQAKKLKPDYLVVSPGPGTPKDAGVSNELIKYFSDKIPVLGVCLGHQCIVEVFGGVVTNASRLMHGKISEIHHDGKTIYKGLANPFTATRYHSLIALKTKLPKCLELSAYTKQGEVMGVRLKNSQVEGVQFHPESILTEEGKKIIKNFLKK